MIRLLFAILGLLAVACNFERKAQSPEIGKVLAHYRSDLEKYHAAEFIADNIEGKEYLPDGVEALFLSGKIDSLVDLYGEGAARSYLQVSHIDLQDTIYSDGERIRADSLIASIDQSYMVWAKCPWASNYTRDQFYRFVLPYRIRREPLEYYWKQDLYRRFGSIVNTSGTQLEYAAKLNDLLPFDFNAAYMGIGLQGYSSLMRTGRGRCDDATVLKAMVLRSVGIPAAIDFVPYWGSQNNGHSMCVLIQPDGVGIDIEKIRVDSCSKFEHKVTKIYRYVYEIQRKSILYKYRETDEIPDLFRDFSSVDVTREHGVDVACVKIDYPPTDAHIAYLSVFSRNGWIPVAYTKAGKKHASFVDIGVGQTNGVCHSKGVDIGEGIVYLPSFFLRGQTIPSGVAFIQSKTGRKDLKPDLNQSERITLFRKYPARSRVVNFAKSMQYGLFEVANKPDFSDAKLIHTIDKIPDFHLQRVVVLEPSNARYVRYRRDRAGFSIAEMQVEDKIGKVIRGIPICEPVLRAIPGLDAVFDCDLQTYFELNEGMDLWVGLDFGKPMEIGAIAFCPRTDNNDIEPGDLYELFYWDNEWISLGQQKATDYFLIYDHVPKNALLWLRNLTKGVEERPFTYENGRQLWW